jgi:hypothetical protein
MIYQVQAVQPHVSFWGHVGNFLYSNLFVGLITLGVGWAAYRVYSKQKRDAKRDAANVVLLEIENAEQQIQKINETQSDNPVQPGIYLMKEASWSKYRYLFVRDFDRTEWDNISDFYNKCRKFDVAVAYQESLFEKNMAVLRSNLQNKLANLAEDHAAEMLGKDTDEQRLLEEEYFKKRRQFISTYMSTNPDFMYMHYPIQPVNAAKAVLDSIEGSLSLTSVGIKLKQLASPRSRLLAFQRKG